MSVLEKRLVMTMLSVWFIDKMMFGLLRPHGLASYGHTRCCIPAVGTSLLQRLENLQARLLVISSVEQQKEVVAENLERQTAA